MVQAVFTAVTQPMFGHWKDPIVEYENTEAAEAEIATRPCGWKKPTNPIFSTHIVEPIEDDPDCYSGTTITRVILALGHSADLFSNLQNA